MYCVSFLKYPSVQFWLGNRRLGREIKSLECVDIKNTLSVLRMWLCAGALSVK